MIRRHLGVWIGGWLWAASALGQALEWVGTSPVQPEMATGWRSQSEVVSPHWAVVAAHPLATQAGYDILQAGGSALDAAVAVQMVLTLVEPQSSGLGGGALLLHSQGRFRRHPCWCGVGQHANGQPQSGFTNCPPPTWNC